MVNMALCRWCGKQGHLIESCPERNKVTVLSDAVKKPWVKAMPDKPKAVEVAHLPVESSALVAHSDEMVAHGNTKQDRWRERNRESYMEGRRDYMKRYRAEKRGAV